MTVDILTGWKDIAKHIGVTEQTAMRYYKLKGLPVKKNRAGHPAIMKSAADNWRLGIKKPS